MSAVTAYQPLVPFVVRRRRSGIASPAFLFMRGAQVFA